jgi:ankyrin repeat protein
MGRLSAMAKRLSGQTKKAKEPSREDWHAALSNFSFPETRSPVTPSQSRFDFNNDDLVDEILNSYGDEKKEYSIDADAQQLRPPTIMSDRVSPHSSTPNLGSHNVYSIDQALSHESLHPLAYQRRPSASLRLSKRISAALNLQPNSASSSRRNSHASHGGNELTELLCEAAAAGNVDQVGRILGAGGDKDKRSGDGLAPLHVAAMAGQGDVVRCLALSGANINAKDSRGCTPLHRAVLCNRVPLVQWMAKLGADLEARDAQGRTALHLAAMVATCSGGLPIPGVLPSPRNSATLAFSYAFGPSQNRGSCASQSGNSYEDCTILEALLRANADKEAKDKDGETALHLAVRFGDIENVKVLLNYGANINARNKARLSPLGVMAQSQQADESISQLLLDQGALVTPIDSSNGWVGKATD